jgi:hypothetical protein
VSFVITCSTATGEGTIDGGEPSTAGLAEALGYSSCTINKTGCAVTEVKAIKLPYTMTLGGAKEPYTAKMGSIDIDIIIKAVGCPKMCEVSGEFPLTGYVEGEVNNTKSEIEFPETALAGSTLELDGKTATLVGKYSIKQSLETSEAVTVGS